MAPTMAFAAVLVVAVALLAWPCSAAKDADEVTALPGWDKPLPSKLYSGYLPGQAAGQSFQSHYVFTEARTAAPKESPLVIWQQGGPGCSGFGAGYMMEFGTFHLSNKSLQHPAANGVPALWENPYSWDNLANVLLFEHPPGTGFSYCEDASGKPKVCEWNDETQAEAFQHSIEAFLQGFPEYAANDVYIIGESYAGLLIPNLAYRLATTPNKINLKAIAVGNGCTGVPGQSVDHPGTCNLGGNFDVQHNVDLFFGHGMVSKKLYSSIYKACNFTCTDKLEACLNEQPKECSDLLNTMNQKVGDYNVYNIYDTCGPGNMQTGTSANHVARLDGAAASDEVLRGAPPYSWDCDTGKATAKWMNTPSVRAALHVKPQSFYGYPWAGCGGGIKYNTYTHSSLDVYPTLIGKYRVTIFNGDVDACVPYLGNEDWTTAMAAKLGLTTQTEFTPWLVGDVVAGYKTTYSSNFSFVTVKEAGHMVPAYQPMRAFAFLQRWLTDTPF